MDAFAPFAWSINNQSDIECRDVNEQNSSLRCAWVQTVPSCKDHDGYLDYLYFIYCALGENGLPGAVSLIIFWLLLLFIALGVTADDFLCPALVIISKTLRLSQNIAGVTFLAFGNGAPDIFSSLAGIQQARSDLVIGELFGAGMFVTTIVTGTIVVFQDFKIMERPFLRDIIFYIFATFWAFCLFYYHQIKIQYAAGFVALYGVYIVVVIISRIVYQRGQAREELKKQQESSTLQPPCEITVTGPPEDAPTSRKPSTNGSEVPSTETLLFKNAKNLDDPESFGVVLAKFSYRKSMPYRRRRLSSFKDGDNRARSRSLVESIYSITGNGTEDGKQPWMSKSADSPVVGLPQPVMTQPPVFTSQRSTSSLASLLSRSTPLEFGPWKEFFYEIAPVDLCSWHEKKWYGKTVEVLKAPVYFLLSVTTPIVDDEAERSNWCKYLNVLHCMTGPIFVCFCTQKWHLLIGGVFPLWAFVLLVSFVLALIVACTSTVEDPPRYHFLFAYLGFAVSVMWIYAIAHEIVSLLKSIGVVFDMSDTILGLTVLAWGNSIGDYISNTSVARQGFPRMGISACFGGPLLNLLLGIGIPYTASLVQIGSPMVLKYTDLVTVLYAGLAISLVSTLCLMTFMRFQTKRWYGILLILIYFLFLAVAILVELQVIA